MTAIADLFDPEVWYDALLEITGEKSRLFQSGVMYRSTDTDNRVSAEGTTWTVPFVKDLTGESQVLYDDGTNPLVPTNLNGGDAQATKFYRGHAWSISTILGWATGIDPVQTIIDRVGAWWDRQFQKTTIAILDGLFGNAAPASAPTNADFYNDQQLSIYSDAAGNVAASTTLTADTFIDLLAKMEDDLDATGVVIMHSDTYRSLEKQDLIQFYKPSQDVTIPYYQGHEVIVDNGVPKYNIGDTPPGGTVLAHHPVYVTYVLGMNTIAFGTGAVPDRDAFEMTPAGLESMSNIITRRAYGINPFGANWTNHTKAGPTPSNAECQNNLNWTRKWERSAVNIYRIVHNNQPIPA